MYTAEMLPLFLLACAKPPAAAPATVDELSITLLREFESEAPEATASELAAWLIDNADAQDGFTLGPVVAADVADMPYDGGEDGDPDLTKQRGVAVTHRVTASLDAHVAIVPEADQSFADPTYDTWDRTLLEGDAEGLASGEGLRTFNVIVKNGAGNVTIPYDMSKDYRWVTLTLDDQPVDTLMFRSWSLEPGWGEDGRNGLVYGWTVELWVPDGDNDMIWYNASWCWLSTILDGLVDEDFVISEIIAGTVDYMDGTDQHAIGD